MSKNKKSYSSNKINLFAKIKEYILQFKGHYNRVFNSRKVVEKILSNIKLYDNIFRKYSNKEIKSAKIFEIGYGARPNLLLTMIGMNIDAFGIDLEKPLLKFKWRNFRTIIKTNGVERFLKSFFRYIIFDLSERKQIVKSLEKMGYNNNLDEYRFLVNDIVDLKLDKNVLDLIISEDVFEHIPFETLTKIIPQMHNWLKDNGLALIKPNIFTGITGGHLAEWSNHNVLNNVLMKRKSEPWEHLRKNRFKSLSYLNKLTRSDYRKLFETHFNILEEIVIYPDLGKAFMTSELRKDLENYSVEELFSNQVLFVLSPK